MPPRHVNCATPDLSTTGIRDCAELACGEAADALTHLRRPVPTRARASDGEAATGDAASAPAIAAAQAGFQRDEIAIPDGGRAALATAFRGGVGPAATACPIGRTTARPADARPMIGAM